MLNAGFTVYDGDLGTRSGFGGSGTRQVRRRDLGSFLIESRSKDKVTVGLAVGIILSVLGQLLQGISIVLRGGLFQQEKEKERERERERAEVSQRNLRGELSVVERDRNFS